DVLVVLGACPSRPTRAIRKFHFCRSGGERLCSIDYGELPPPYNRAIVTMPNVAHHAIIDSVARQRTAAIRYRTSCVSLVREGDRVAGLMVEGPEGPYLVKSRLVVGADGAFSKGAGALWVSPHLHLSS